MGLSFSETVTVAFFTATTTALLTWGGQVLVAYLQRGNDRVRHRREKVLDRYSELLSLLTQDVNRAKEIQSIAAISLGKERLPELIKERYDTMKRLGQLSMVILMLETRQEIALIVAELAKSQPFEPFLYSLDWSNTGYDESFQRHQAAITTLENKSTELAVAVKSAYGEDGLAKSLGTMMKTIANRIDEFYKSLLERQKHQPK